MIVFTLLVCLVLLGLAVRIILLQASELKRIKNTSAYREIQRLNKEVEDLEAEKLETDLKLKEALLRPIPKVRRETRRHQKNKSRK